MAAGNVLGLAVVILFETLLVLKCFLFCLDACGACCWTVVCTADGEGVVSWAGSAAKTLPAKETVTRAAITVESILFIFILLLGVSPYLSILYIN